MPCIAVFEDNEGAIQIAKNPVTTSNSNHIDVRHRFWELVAMKEISLIHGASEFHHADLMTKVLPTGNFTFHRHFAMSIM